jgi:hypothetical protein
MTLLFILFESIQASPIGADLPASNSAEMRIIKCGAKISLAKRNYHR